MWLLSGLIIIFAVLIYCFSPKVEITPNVLMIDETVVKSVDGVKRIQWNDAKLLFRGQIIGPESITHDPLTGNIFTGTYDGLIWKINKDLTEAEIVLRTGEDHKECGSPEFLSVCGRVLGLKFVAENTLIVADAYLGIISVDVISRTKEVLVQPDSCELTASLKLFNSVDVSDDGVVYFTVSSMKWPLHDFLYSYMEAEATGRVYSYNLLTRNLVLIADNIAFANGIVLSHDQESLLFCELTLRRILKIDLNDPTKIGVFIDHLPGPPDNLKKGPGKSYLVSLPAIDSTRLPLFASSHPFVNAWSAWLFPKWILIKTFNLQSIALQLDEQGHIIASIGGENKNIEFVTEAYEANGYIFLGSVISKHLAVVDATGFKIDY